MKKIFVIGLGGTIGSVKRDSIGLDENNLKILDFVKYDDVAFTSASPFSVLSENMSIELWRQLIEYIDGIDFNGIDGVIILHGSDTLSFTAGIIANAFDSLPIVLVASDKPVEDKDSNAVDNFDRAVDALCGGISCPMVSYDGLYKAGCITAVNEQDGFISIDGNPVGVNSKTLYDKNILIIKSYVGIDVNNYNFDNADAVLVGMYHSATVPEMLSAGLEKIGKPVYYVTHRSSAEYESMKNVSNIIFNSTLENAYARILLTNDNLVL